MDTPSPPLRELARRLWAASLRACEPHAPRTQLVNENLTRSMVQFAGVDGFRSLLRRSITLAAAEVSVLRAATVTPEGRVQGIDQLVEDAATTEQAAIAVMAHMLGLLVTFIGEPLTYRLVREACPEASPDE